MDKSDSAETPDQYDCWFPPTPRSQLVPLPPPNLPVDHLVLLPPPLLSHPSYGRNTTFNAPFSPPPSRRPSLPSLQSFLGLSSTSSTSTMSSASHLSTQSPNTSVDLEADARLAASLAEDSSKRPRRSAAVAASRKIPRQPSPFDLEDDGGGDAYAAEEDEEEGDDDAHSESAPPNSSRKKTTANGGATGGGGAGASKRKVSHSLIERRRREKINQCLQTLKEMVPSLREQGEEKLKKARERGRKRGRGDDAGERGGLHKLEILQGTIAHLEDLRAQVAQLQRSPSSSYPSSSIHSPPVERPTRQAPTPSPDSLESDSTPSFTLPSPLMRASISTALEMSIRHPVDFNLAAGPGGGNGGGPPGGVVDDHEAGMLLLNFSTSPELRPVYM